MSVVMLLLHGFQKEHHLFSRYLLYLDQRDLLALHNICPISLL